MAEDIINRVANSKLKVLDLEDYYPLGSRILLDIKDWLLEGFVLREKEFRAHVATHNWEQYQNAYVALTCTTDAIVPAWAYMLITVELEPFAEKVNLGDLKDLETSIYQDIINDLDVSEFKDAPVIIKGCSKKPVPESAYVMISNKIRPVAKSIMFGEACSSVPLYKRK
ncbi:conserved hypothetical protein (DUF2480) [Formosa agariphila KMM 3901]|uniref:DUF2480 family protein n=1 Tax=Formosa agariphila (strain DSM 15362 / KCTC 12365 / LMG 23005 / KMM 3901 / M-2Alg 35-1) TaxID=1347342 RepID=T2KRB8_FORAG|nr:DUF2480 family protein [Formosa agariphila]CDF81001.1 conserved hypothetical protein (DUF2480) [Formosa agariphila KMM 3901]